MADSRFDYRKIPKEKVPCPLCRGDDFEVVATHDRYGMGVRTCVCRMCGLLMTNPMPTQEAMSEFYQLYYRRVYHKLEAPTLNYIETNELARRAAHTVSFLEESGLIDTVEGVLDEGCGEGSVLKEIKQRRPRIEIVGIEPGPGFRAFARSFAECQVFPSICELKRERLAPFGLIVVNHVLEHVTDPVRFLRELATVLSAEGAIYVDVPDASAYSSLDDLHIAHLYHFSPRTLAAVAHKAGLCVSHLGRHSPPRHPRSIRCVLKLNCFETSAEADELNENDVIRLIKSIDVSAWRYRLRQRRLGRLFLRGVEFVQRAAR